MLAESLGPYSHAPYDCGFPVFAGGSASSVELILRWIEIRSGSYVPVSINKHKALDRGKAVLQAVSLVLQKWICRMPLPQVISHAAMAKSKPYSYPTDERRVPFRRCAGIVEEHRRDHDNNGPVAGAVVTMQSRSKAHGEATM